MDTEQYEEAVRDYEKIYKIDKTRGEYEKICKQEGLLVDGQPPASPSEQV